MVTPPLHSVYAMCVNIIKKYILWNPRDLRPVAGVLAYRHIIDVLSCRICRLIHDHVYTDPGRVYSNLVYPWQKSNRPKCWEVQGWKIRNNLRPLFRVQYKLPVIYTYTQTAADRYLFCVRFKASKSFAFFLSLFFLTSSPLNAPLNRHHLYVIYVTGQW